MALGWGISLELVGVCSRVKDVFIFFLSHAPSLGKGPASNCLEDSPCLPVIYSHAGASLSSLQAGLKTAA